MKRVRSPESEVRRADRDPNALDLRSAILALLIAVAAGCSASGGLTPLTYPDPGGPCPAGRTGWTLEVLDRRADRESSESVISLIGESIRRSFPGCGWDAEAGQDAGRITIEVHRFASVPSGGTWDATAEWTVLARDSGGRTIAEFETKEEVSRPDYRGSNNEKASLREAFDKALKRTLSGLRVVSTARNRPPVRTHSS